MIAALLLLALQDPARWVEKLGSDAVDAREEAAARLVAAGKAAIPALENALKSPDREIAARAKEVIVRIHRAEPYEIRLRKDNREYDPAAVEAELRKRRDNPTYADKRSPLYPVVIDVEAGTPYLVVAPVLQHVLTHGGHTRLTVRCDGLEETIDFSWDDGRADYQEEFTFSFCGRRNFKRHVESPKAHANEDPVQDWIVFGVRDAERCRFRTGGEKKEREGLLEVLGEYMKAARDLKWGGIIDACGGTPFEVALLTYRTCKAAGPKVLGFSAGGRIGLPRTVEDPVKKP